MKTVELKIRNGVRKAVCRVWGRLRACFRNLSPEIISHSVALAFVTHKEEELVLDDAPSSGRSKLLQGNRPLFLRWRVKVIACVPRAVASESVCGAVKAVCAGFDSNVDNCSGLPSVFGRRIFLNVEFLDGINGHQRGRITGNSWTVDDRQALQGVVVGQTL